MDFPFQWIPSYFLTIGIFEILLKLTIVLVATGVLCWKFKNATAELRKAFWISAIVFSLCLPVIVTLLPSIPAPISFNNQSTQGSIINEVSSPSLAGWQDSMRNEISIASADNREPDSKVSDQVPSVLAPTQQPISTSLLIKLTAFAWFFGVACLLVKLVKSIVFAKNLVANARKEDLVHSISPALLLSKRQESKISFLVSEEIESPVAIGIIKPIILLPGDYIHWPQKKQQATILHELGHVQKHDNLFRLIAYLASTFYWFHPLMWYAVRRLIEEQEITADNYVIKRGLSPTNYAQSLVEVVKQIRSSDAVSPIFSSMASQQFLLHRMRSLLNSSISKAQLSRGNFSFIFIVTLTASFFVGALGVEAQKSYTAEDDLRPVGYEVVVRDQIKCRCDPEIYRAKISSAITLELDRIVATHAPLSAKILLLDVKTGQWVADGQYGEPREFLLGSHMMTFTVAGALEQEIVKPSETISNLPYTVTLSTSLASDLSRQPSIYNESGVANVTMSNLISLDLKRAQIRLFHKIGSQSMGEVLGKLGLEFPNFNDGDLSQALGVQLKASPIKLTQAYSKIARIEESVFSEANSEYLLQALKKAFEADANEVANVDLLSIAGKYSNSQNNSEMNIIGMFPADNPEYVIFVGLVISPNSTNVSDDKARSSLVGSLLGLAETVNHSLLSQPSQAASSQTFEITRDSFSVNL